MKQRKLGLVMSFAMLAAQQAARGMEPSSPGQIEVHMRSSGDVCDNALPATVSEAYTAQKDVLVRQRHVRKDETVIQMKNGVTVFIGKKIVFMDAEGKTARLGKNLHLDNARTSIRPQDVKDAVRALVTHLAPQFVPPGMANPCFTISIP